MAATTQDQCSLTINGVTLQCIPSSLTDSIRLLSTGAASAKKVRCASTGVLQPSGVAYVELSLPAKEAKRTTRGPPPVALCLSAAAPLLRRMQIENLAGYNDLKPAEQAQVQQAVNPAGAGSVKADSDKPAAPSRAQRATRASSRKSDSDAPTVEQQPEEVKEESAGSEDTKEGSAKSEGGGSGNEASEEEEEELDEYERKRREQIERNRQFMAALALHEAGAAVAAMPTRAPKPSRAKEKGPTGTKRSAPEDPAERRVSLRVRGVQADPVLAAGVLDEARGGAVLLAAQAGVRSIWTAQTGEGEEANADAAAPQQVKQKGRHPEGPLPFEMSNGSEKTDAAFLEYLRTRLSSGESGDSSPAHVVPSVRDVVTLGSLKKLQLQENDVAKVTKKGTSAMAWHPSEGELLLAAGDKDGQVALWQVDCHAAEGAEFDGVAVFDHVHNDYVSSLVWASNPGSSATATNHLLTTSYDGSIRLLDVGEGKFLDYTKGVPKRMQISACDVDPHSKVAYIGDPDGEMQIVDLRAGDLVRPGIVTHLKRVNSIHIEPSQRNLLVTAGSDAVVRVWDIRKLGPQPFNTKLPAVSPLYELNHRQSCHSAYWAPDGSQRIVSTSFDDTLKIWQVPNTAGGTGKKASAAEEPACITMKHDNQTGRWVTPFRAVWGAKSDFVAVGCMKRGIDVFNASNGTQVSVDLHSDYMTAIPTRLAAHPYKPVFAAATSSGRVHIWR